MEAAWSLGRGEEGLASVIVTAFNQERFLTETLESVALQTHRRLECIIIDDGSTDETPRVVEYFRQQHATSLRIKSVRQKNQGVQCARNTGILESSGEFIQFLDGDDLLGTDKIRLQIEKLRSCQKDGVDVVYGDSKWLNEVHDGFQAGDDIGMGPSADVLESMLQQRWNPMFSYLCRRTAVEANDRWNPSIRIAQDVDYFLRMAMRGLRFAYVPVMAGQYRKHRGARISDGRMTLRARTMLGILRSAEELGQQAGTLSPTRRRALAGAYRRISYWAYGLDRDVWKDSLENFLRLCPEMPPESMVARCLQSLVGVWRSEATLGVLRDFKRRMLEQLSASNATSNPPSG